MFITAEGLAADSAEELLPSRPVISASKAALMLSAPAIEFEYLPRPLWSRIEFVRAGLPVPLAEATSAGVLRQFRAAVSRGVGDVAAVGVSFSGGLDSLAVLWHADRVCRAAKRRLIATVIDLKDDDGSSAAISARRLIRDMKIQAELIVIDPRMVSGRSAKWSADGPSFMSTPDLVAAASDAAQEAGAEVLLDGVGGDEVLQFAGFGLSNFLGCARMMPAIRYTADVIKFDRQAGAIGELAGLAARLLPARLSFSLYHAFHWTSLLDEHASAIVAEQFRPVVDAYVEDWLRERIRQFIQHGKSWSRMAAIDCLVPFEPMRAAGDLPARSPFLEEYFVRYVAGLPLSTRYDHRAQFPYHRWKALTVSLFPAEVQRALPRYKQLYRRALSQYRTMRPQVERLSEQFGIVGPGQASEPRAQRSVRALDDWLAGALDRGARIES
jgi:asparagine synthase (glutamine-hydrolysing)